jgi:hypothetical protein
VPGVPFVRLYDQTPTANAAMSTIEDFVRSNTPQPGKAPFYPPGTGQPAPTPTLTSLDKVENLRRSIGRMTPQNAEDARALKEVRKGFETWFDQNVDKATGSNQAEKLAKLKEGRALSKKGLELEMPSKRDEGGQAISKIVAGTTTPEEIASLFSPNKQGVMPMAAPHTLNRLVDKFGAGSAEVGRARDIVMQGLMRGGPQQVSNNIKRFFEQSPTTAEKMFSPDQVATLKRYGNVESRLVPKPEATNPSRSGSQALSSILQAKGAGAGALVGGTVGGVLETMGIPHATQVGTVLGAGGGTAINDIYQRALASRAISQPVPPVLDRTALAIQLLNAQRAAERERRGQ